jgi:hypothetical protein
VAHSGGRDVRIVGLTSRDVGLQQFEQRGHIGAANARYAAATTSLVYVG